MTRQIQQNITFKNKVTKYLLIPYFLFWKDIFVKYLEQGLELKTSLPAIIKLLLLRLFFSLCSVGDRTVCVCATPSPLPTCYGGGG